MNENELKDYLNEWLRYEPETGKLFWKKDGPYRRKGGSEAGTTDGWTCYLLKIKGVLYKVHRLIFLMVEGYLPKIVDHKNRDQKDNRWGNLRDFEAYQNCLNRSLDKRNKTGITGVRFNPKERTYVVTYGKRYLGCSKDFFEACCIRKSKEEYFG